MHPGQTERAPAIVASSTSAVSRCSAEHSKWSIVLVAPDPRAANVKVAAGGLFRNECVVSAHTARPTVACQGPESVGSFRRSTSSHSVPARSWAGSMPTVRSPTVATCTVSASSSRPSWGSARTRTRCPRAADGRGERTSAGAGSRDLPDGGLRPERTGAAGAAKNVTGITIVQKACDVQYKYAET